MAKKSFSRRAGILKRVLDWVNLDKYDDRFDYMIFGKSLQEVIDEETQFPTEEVEDEESERVVDKAERFVRDVKLGRGRELASERTLLKKTPFPFERRAHEFLESLSSKERDFLLRSLEKAKSGKELGSESRQGDSIDDFLDAHYANEVLTKLDKIVRRAPDLARMETATIPDENTRLYFHEAHQCFLYGFPIAAAVLCRAILEALLPERLDPKHEIRKEMKGATQTEYYKKLTYEARQWDILKDDCEYCKSEGQPYRVTKVKDHSPDCPVGIIEAGNRAIHDATLFSKEYASDKPEELLLNTREIVIALLSEKAS